MRTYFLSASLLTVLTLHSNADSVLDTVQSSMESTVQSAQSIDWKSIDWKAEVSANIGNYNTSSSMTTLYRMGLGFDTEPFSHRIYAGLGQVEGSGHQKISNYSSTDQPDRDLWEMAYRCSYKLKETLSVFGELGQQSIQGTAHEIDALGNPKTLNFDSTHNFLGLGITANLYKGLNLEGSVRYLPSIEGNAFGYATTDALGNFYIRNNKTPDVQYQIGLSYTF